MLTLTWLIESGKAAGKEIIPLKLLGGIPWLCHPEAFQGIAQHCDVANGGGRKQARRHDPLPQFTSAMPAGNELLMQGTQPPENMPDPTRL